MLNGNVLLHITTPVLVTGLQGATEEELIVAALGAYTHGGQAQAPEVSRYEVQITSPAEEAAWSLWHDKDFLDVHHAERVNVAQIFALEDFAGAGL